MPDYNGSIQILTNEQLKTNLEILLDKIAEATILNITKYTSTPIPILHQNQKTIHNGIVSTLASGLTSDNILVLYQQETKANPKDTPSFEESIQWNLDEDGNPVDYNIVALTAIVDSWGDIDVNMLQVEIFGIGDGVEYTVQVVNHPNISDPINITPYVVDGNGNPPNISQFVDLGTSEQNIDPLQANEYLNTNIYELLPQIKTRQQRIDEFFAEYQALKGLPPEYITDEFGDLSAPELYSEDHDISTAQDGDPTIGVNEENAFITRLNIDSNTKNSAKTLQYLRNDLNAFLKDVDQDASVGFVDERPEYVNKSTGYLKIRGLNQSIIIRKQEGDEIGLEELVSIPEQESHPVSSYIHPHDGATGPSYLMDGFTISMWVRFLDKTSNGTLFNFGNPTRSLDPKGFKLETFILNQNEIVETDSQLRTWGDIASELNLPTFNNGENARFIRLVVYDHIKDNEDGIRKLYDSRLPVLSTATDGSGGLPRSDNSVPEFGYELYNNYQKGNEINLLGHIQIPIDFKEWFFIVASFNPMTHDQLIVPDYNLNIDYWKGHFIPDATGQEYIQHSGYGSKCKVEFISRSDLLRARGYKV
mgnify:CR=1 FL=1